MTKKIFFIVLILMLATLFVVATPVTYASGGTSYNYAKPGDLLPSVIRADEILSQALNEELSSLEKEYLSDYELKIKYTSSVSISNVVAELENSKLTLTLSPFEYIADNSERILWLPSTVDGDKVNYENGLYSYVIDDVSTKDADYVDIVYQALLKVDSDDINKYINSAYEYALSVNRKLEAEEQRYLLEQETYTKNYSVYSEYLNALEGYNNDLQAYNSYLQAYSLWEAKSNRYNQYLLQKAEYEAKQERYEAYLVKLEEYNAQYQRYREYLAKMLSYEKEYAEYEKAVSSTEKQTALYQLEILNFITKPVTDMNRTLSGAILGESVTKVLAEKESLVTIGKVESKAVDLASNATTKLRALINSYLQCSTDAEKYAFFILSKEDLTESFIDLLVALDYIYQYPDYTLVRRIMAKENGVEKYEILLAQLYCICHALTEGELPNYVVKYKGANKTYAGYFDENYTIGLSSPRTPEQILGEDYLEDKSLSEPLENGFPGLPEKPVEPEKVEEPIRPTAVSKPVEPQSVDNPGDAPVKVDVPICPEVIDEPVLPVEYQPTESEENFRAGYLDGILIERELLNGDIYVKATATVSKYFRNAKIVTIRFFDGVSDEPIWVVKDAEVGSSVDFNGTYPTKVKEGYTCTFAGWRDKEGNIVDCNHLQTDKSDLDLYPLFEELPKSYSLSWIVNGITRTSEHLYDSIPVYNEDVLGKLEKKGSGVRDYRFIGWSSNGVFYPLGEPLEVVCGNREYVGVFEQSHVVTFVIDGIGKSQAVWNGELPIEPDTPYKEGTSDKYFLFSGWDEEIEEVYEDKTYNAIFDSYYYACVNNLPLEIVSTDIAFSVNCRSYRNDYEIANLLNVAFSEEKSISFCCVDGDISFSRENVEEFYSLGVTGFRLESVIQASGGYKLIFKLFNENGQVESVSKVRVSLPDFEVTERSHLMATRNNIKKEVSYSIKDDSLVIDMTPSTIYTMCKLYLVSAISSENAEIGVNKNYAEVGDKITVKVSNLIDGAYITGLYLVNGEGENSELNGYSFLMPASDVTVGILTEFYKYTITFKANGKTLFTTTYKYGEKVTAPSVPDITAEEGYIYKFTGWDKVVSVATEDCEYNAVFEKQENKDVDSVPQGGKLDILAKLFKPLLYGGIALVVIIVILIILAVYRKRRKKSKKGK